MGMNNDRDNPNRTMTFDEYKRKVAECLMKSEGFTEADVKRCFRMRLAEAERLAGSRATTVLEELYEDFQEGLNPLTAAQVLVA